MTVEEKIQHYKNALKRVKESQEHLICISLKISLTGNVHSSPDDVFIDFPELIKYKPDVCYRYGLWFPMNDGGQQERIALLEEIIFDLSNQ